MRYTLLLFLLIVLPFQSSIAIEDPKSMVEEKKVGFFSELGKKIDLNVRLTDASGQEKLIRDVINPALPIIVLPVYYECPRLCGLTLNGFLDLVNSIELSLGKEFQVVTVSMDTDESWELARDKSNNVFKEVNRSDFNRESWHFFVGKEEVVKPFLNSVGFKYQKDGQEYAHASGFIVLTPDGEISQYFTGIEFPKWDVRLALIEASKGKIGSALDHILLFCFRFDPTRGKYSWAAYNTVRIGVLISLLLCVGLAFTNSKRLKRSN